MRKQTARRALAAAVVSAALTATTLTTTASAAPAGSHDATQAAMDAQVAAGVPGVLGETRNGRDAWHGSSGVADLTTHRPRLAQDRFRVGSISKAFTSTVLLQLESEGRIDLDDTVEQWLPGVVDGNGNDGSRITVRQVLNHTSGIFNYTEDPAMLTRITKDFLKVRYDTYTPRQLVDIAVAHAPYAAPGEKWHYSNTNYILAGMIVEKVTGRSYATEIRERIIRPLRLNGTTLPGTSPRMPGPHGRAYSKLLDPKPDAKIYDVTELNPSWGGSAGEIISTTGDLNRFYHALLGGKLLPEKQQQELTTTVPTDEKNLGRYGLGVSSATLPCGKVLWFHGGGIHGSTSMAAADADGRHTAAFNFNGDWTGDTTGMLLAEYCGTTKPADAGATRSALNRLAALR
ncbi:serine hydrolase domain-containing protein [Streptomyces sp. NPDC001262]|uniref:serine hydrolase domain-containing protein n=1 Tax=Streptomyces sp. NPDC001262 TaxID=3364552 RepID=UPI00368F9943